MMQDEHEVLDDELLLDEEEEDEDEDDAVLVDEDGDEALDARFLTRKEAAEFLARIGLPVTINGLHKYAHTGGGPPYRMFGNRSVYLPSELKQWALSKLRAPKTSTSEAA